MTTSLGISKSIAPNLSPVDLLWGQKLRSENASQQKELRGLETRLTTLRRRTEELETMTMRRISILEMDNRSLRKEVETLMRTDLCRKVEIELSASKIGHLETENKALKEQIERTRDAACGTSTFQDQVQGSVDLVSARLHELQSKVEELKKDRVNGKGNRVEGISSLSPILLFSYPYLPIFESSCIETYQNHTPWQLQVGNMQCRLPSPTHPSTDDTQSLHTRRKHRTVAPVQEDERSCSAPQPRNPSKRKKVLISSGRLETAPVQEAEHVHFLPQLEKPSKRRKTLAPSDRPLAQEREKVYCPPQPTYPRKKRTLDSLDY